MPRSAAFNRDMTWRKAIRKRKIANAIYHIDNSSWEYYSNLHQYSKNKIHCSCPMCSAKTKDRRVRGAGYGQTPGHYNYTISDRRKVEAMEADLNENL